jgi:hypothetical protein
MKGLSHVKQKLPAVQPKAEPLPLLLPALLSLAAVLAVSRAKTHLRTMEVSSMLKTLVPSLQTIKKSSII